MILEVQDIIRSIRDIRKAIFSAERLVKTPKAKGLKRKLVALADRMEIMTIIWGHEIDKDEDNEDD